MWNWYSGDGTPSPAADSDNSSSGTMSVADLTEQLAQNQQLVVQLKDLIREKDNDLRKKDQQLKEEKESSDSKVSKAKLQSKAKIASLTSQLEELKKQLASPEAPQGQRSEKKKGSADGDQENASANRGKILVLRKRVEELESQLATKNEALQKKGAELEAQRLRGSEMDAMLAAKEKKLAEKEAYIVDLQMAAASNLSQDAAVTGSPASPQDSNQDLQILIHNLNRKVGESEEKYSLLREQTESLKALLNKEKSTFQEKEAMYTENIRVYQNMILEKEKEMKELSQKHDQEIFKLAAKSDATAELHQLLKALKQKLHEEEEVLSGKNQVIDVLQKELDNKDQQISEMNEKCRRLLSEKENLQSKLDAEKHIMRAQLKDMMERHETEIRTVKDCHSKTLQDIQEKHEVEIQEKFQTIQQLQGQLQGLVSPGEVRTGSQETTDNKMIKLQEEVKLKKEEASKSEAKFLKLKAWSKSRIRQLEEELKIAESKNQELSQLSAHVAELEEEKRGLEIKLQSVADLQAFNEQLLAKLVVYEEQQRKLQADLEQVAKRADSQTSESGSVDEMHNQLLEWHEMSADSDITPEQEREETSALALRMAQIEEEREAMDSGQVELEEELSAARGVGKIRPPRRKESRGATKLQDEFNYSNKSFEDQSLAMESSDIIEGENMGGLRAVVEELELERNQLQEQIMTLEERCQELEDRLQLQLRIESLQGENERLQSQVSQVRQQQSQESEKYHDLISTLNDQLKGFTNRNAFLENAIVEKEQTILEATSRLDQLAAVRKALQEKETVNKELMEKLDQSEHQLEEVTKKQKALEAENSTLKQSNSELTEKVSAFKERVLIQDSSLEKLQVDLDQTNEDLDRLNSNHLEERSQLIYDLQRCEREMDVLKELLQEKDKEVSSLSVTLTEYSEQITLLKETMDLKDGQMREMSDVLVRIEREHHLIKEAQTLDVQETSTKISSLTELLSEKDEELNKAKSLNESKAKEAEELIRQINENGITIKNLRQEIQTQSVTHNNHVTECSTQIASLKDQMNASAVKLSETETKYKKEIESLKMQLENDHSEKARLVSLIEEKSNKEQSFENELKATKEQCNHLVSDMTKKDEEMHQLAKHLSEQKDLYNKLSQELSNKQDDVQKNETIAQERENLVKDLQVKTLEFQKQIGEKSEIIKNLHSEKEELQAQYKVIETSISDKESCIQLHIISVEELGKKVQGLEDQNLHLCNEKENLLTQVSQKETEISHLNQTLNDVQSKLAQAENLLSEEQKSISKLSGAKEELLARIEQISAQGSKNDQNFTAQLEEREKECLSLKSQLHDELELSNNLKNRIQSLEKDLQDTQQIIYEKDDKLKATIANYNTGCENAKQQEETNTLLQKQVDKLTKTVENDRKVLQEKDSLLTTQHSQLADLTSNLEKLQHEEQTLKEANVKLAENIEGLHKAMNKLQEDFSHKTEENVTLKERLETSNKDVEKLTLDRDSASLSISNLESQCHALQLQVVHHQSVVDALTQQVSLLVTEKEKINSDIELLNSNMSSKSEEINVLSSHLSQQGHTILSLKDQIDTVQLEKQSLLRSLEEKDALLLQKEELIQHVEKKLEGEGHYLQTISALQNELQSSLSECSLQRQKIKDQEQEMQRLTQQMQLLKDKSEEAGLLKTQLSEHMETISNLHFQMKNLQDNLDELNDALTKKDECLKEKVDSYVSLKTQLSEIQDSLEEQKTHVESLSLENTQYKASVSENNLAIRNSLIECDALKQKLTDKEGQCSMLIQQITDLEKVNRKQNNDLNELKVSIKEQETSLLGKQELLNTQLEEQTKLVSHLQNSIHEFNNTIKDLQQSIVDKENAVQNLQEKYTSLHDRKQELTESLLQKENDISKLLSIADEKDARLQVLESNIQAFTSEVSLLRAELDNGNSSLSDTLRMKDEVLSQHQKATEVLKAELEKLNTEKQETQIQLHALTQEKKESSSLSLNLQEKCNLQNQLIENFKHDVESLHSELTQAQKMAALEIEQFQHELRAANQEKLNVEAMLQMSQAEKDTSLSTSEKQLIEKAETIKQLEEKLEHQQKESEERISSDAGILHQLKSEKADLQKQVSGQAEEIHALNVCLETVECNLSELKQQSEKEYQKVSEQNVLLREQNSSLDSKLKVKENEVQGFLKDLSFVEDQLCVLSDENISKYDSCNEQFSYSGKVEKLSSMLSKALDYKSKVAELMNSLEARDQDLDHKSQTILSLEKESKILQAELQKIKEEKLGSEYAVGELAAAKEALAQQHNILKEKEEVLAQMGRHIASLQEEIMLTKEDLQKSQLTGSEEKAKVLELVEEVKMKSSVVQNLNVQLSQQKELICTLSDQVKEKDSSLMQVMESMSNEMVKFSTEKSTLKLELQKLQSEKSSCLLEISEMSEKLQAFELKLQQSEQILADKELFLCNLTKEKELQLEKSNKERENLKRKLQAALVIRKDLIQKLEKVEQSKQEELNVEQLKMLELEKTDEELNCRLKTVVKENEDLQSHIELYKQQILEKDAQTSELYRVLSEKESLVVELQNENMNLQQSFSEKNGICQDYMKIVQEKEHSFSQAKNALKEKLKALEEENSHLVENLENLKSCLEKAQGKEESPMVSQQVSTNPSPPAGVLVTPESSSSEGPFAHTENTIVHNNVHASLLCTQGNVENKEKHAALLESLGRSVKEFEMLQKAHLELQLAYKANCAECEEQREQVLSLRSQIEAQASLDIHKELELVDKDQQLSQLRQRIEEVSHKLANTEEYENAVSVLKAGLHEKDEELIKMNSEQTQLLSENQLLKNEMQKLSHDVEQKLQEICYLKTAMESQSMDLEKSEAVKESMTKEICVLQKEVETSTKRNEDSELTIQQIAKEKDVFYEDCQLYKVEVTKVKTDLEQRVVELLEKDKEIAVLKDSLQTNVRTSEVEIQKLCKQLEERKQEANKLRSDYDQMKEELEECITKLEKAHMEISDFTTKLVDSRKEEEISIQSNSVQLSNNTDLNQVVPETKSALHNLQGTRDYPPLTCEDCLRKQKLIEELESKVMKRNKAMEDLAEEHKRSISEESSSKEHIQRKLQAALVSRKDLLKENKALKQTIESLNLEADGFKHALEEIQKHQLEIVSLTNKNKDLLSDNERLLVDNENLSAACESLKSTMETIVQEKEAFSFQLNSLKDSQTVELTGWKAKHGELNKEYESLLQAYENVSDEIDKMRHIIDITKREKHDILIKIHDLQNENQILSRQIEGNGEDIVEFRTLLESKDAEIKKLKQEANGIPVNMEKASQFDEIVEKNQQLLEDNRDLQDTCENLKLCLENKEKENNSLFIIKTALDKLQVDMNMYKSDMEIKISEMTSENELLLKKITELSIKLEETEQSLFTVEAERDDLLEKVKSSESLFIQEKEALLKSESDISNMQLEKINLEEKVKILEDDKALLLDEIENIQEQFSTVKNERESMETELLKAVKNNSLLSDKFKTLQAQTNVLSQQVEYLRSEKNNIMHEREEQQLKVLRELEEKVKSAQDDNRGTKSKSKELQEILKEKQQEINQLQQDSIRFQELILDLQATVKESNSQNELLKKKLEHRSTQVRNDVLFLEKDLTDDECSLKHVNNQITRLAQSREVNGERINDNQDFGNEVYSNGIKRGVQGEQVSQSRAEVLPSLKSEQVCHQQVSESQRDDLKALQIVLYNKEEEFQQLKLECEKLRADVQKQVILSEHMKQIINNKDEEISLLISTKDGGISSYLEEIQSRYRKQEEEYEQRLSNVQAQKEKSDLECQKVEKELQNLQLTYEKAVHDKLLLSGEITAFKKSMSSLQTDRDQLYSALQSIHQRNESVLGQKDHILTSTSAENSSLKAELRNVLNRADDLNAENAMLGAQLIRYREDLNQVLSLKDHQLKELLRQKLDHIKNLEQEKCDLNKLNRELQNASAALQSSTNALELENQKLVSKVKDQEDLIATINKEKILFEIRKKNDHHNSTDSQIKDLEEKFNHNIVAFEQNFPLGCESSKMTEKTKKTYSDVLLENKDLKSQNDSFGKAMAALQNNRDSLIDDFKELQWRYACELKSEKIRADDMEKQLYDFKFQLCSLLKKNSLISGTALAAENQITMDQLVAEVDSVCNLSASRGSEIARLSSECAAYVQQVDAFSKAMASLQHDRERLLQQFKEYNIVHESKQGTTSANQSYLATSGSQSDELTRVAETMKSSAAKSMKLKKKVQELEKLLQEAQSIQEKLEKEVTGYQCELSDLRAERNVLVAEADSLRVQFNTALSDRDRQIAELHKHQEIAGFGSVLTGEKVVEKVALVGNSAAPDKNSPHLQDKKSTQQEVQRYIQEIQQRDLFIQQINGKAMELMEMNSVLSAQLKSVSQALKDTQIRYTDLQNQYYNLQRDLQNSQVTSRNDGLTEVPPGAPQERTDVLVEIDNAELADLRRRLAETEFGYETARQELSQLSETLTDERVRREAAEEALHRAEQKNRRLETKSSSREYDFSLQMESDDEREALIIDPTQNVVVRKIKGGTLSIRRWLRGRSIYCSKLLTSRSKSRYIFLTYLVGLHILILMCLTGVL